MSGIYALLDTNILLPSPIYNTILYVAHFDLLNPLWSDEIIHELRRHLREWKGIQPADWRIAQMEGVFTAANIDRQGVDYRAMMDDMPCHPKDRHVLAAAIAGEADYLVTENVRDFWLAGTAYQDALRVCTADAFLCEVFDRSQQNRLNMLSALFRQIQDMRSLHTLDPLLSQLATQGGCPQFVARIRALRAGLPHLPPGVVSQIHRGQRIP